MNVQSLSIVVPNKNCINNCKFCVSKMHTEDYTNQLDYNLPFYDLYIKDYKKRMEFARDNGCNTVMLTGNSEPQQNRQFLMMFGLLNQSLEKPFRNIEMQTTGVLLDEGYLRFLRNHVGVNVISLSVSSFFDSMNNEIIGTKLPIDLKRLCALIKKYDFTLRLSINLTNAFNMYIGKPDWILNDCKEYGADQVTFRVMYQSGNNTEKDKWIEENKVNPNLLQQIQDYVKLNGRFLDILEYGAKRYSVKGMSTVIDNDCMSETAGRTFKYLILRENCKLYSKWDDPASIIF